MTSPNVCINNGQPLAIDLFCGAGGLSLGFQMAGYRIALGVEKEELPCTTHQFNFDSPCHQGDIKAITDPHIFIEHYGLDHVDVIIGGPPCQGFSRVGRGKIRSLLNDPTYIHDPRNQYYREFIRFVEVLRPLYFVIENVPDLQNYVDGDGLLLEKALHALQQLGYTTEYRVLRADQYGVPQSRKRLFIIGNRLHQTIVWPSATHTNTPVTVWQAISDLPLADIKQRRDEIPYQGRCELNSYQRLMREGAGAVLYNHQTRWHNADDIEAFRLLPQGGRYIDLPDRLRRYDSKKHPDKRNEYFKDRYRKLIRDAPAWTLEAHIGKDTYRFIYPSEEGQPEPPRTISVREAARLQSFPDRFRFRGPFTQQFTQVGNAVPPLLAKAVAEAILPGVRAGIAAR